MTFLALQCPFYATVLFQWVVLLFMDIAFQDQFQCNDPT